MRIVFSAVTLAAGLFAGGALAQDINAAGSQSKDDIVKFFASAVDLGKARGICVGTEAECSKKPGAPVPTGLDMLINFDLDSADLTPNARQKLGQFAEALKDSRLKAHSFTVEGYTDASGSEIYNAGLSERRARSVASFLLASGIEPSRLKAKGMGEGKPRVADPYDPENRRVEMRIDTQ
jgi:OmpA-OmpF porin, OOP family